MEEWIYWISACHAALKGLEVLHEKFILLGVLNYHLVTVGYLAMSAQT